MPVRPALMRFTLPLTQLPGPVVAVPIGELGGLPFGVQLCGRPRSEALLLGLAEAIVATAAP
jgi:Asp-tRNA(Asn)/Glu-tRNA(Gln) amidotransferase A subunit family amidase